MQNSTNISRKKIGLRNQAVKTKQKKQPREQNQSVRMSRPSLEE